MQDSISKQERGLYLLSGADDDSAELVIICNFVTIAVRLRNTFTGLILPSVVSVFYIYLLKNFSQIPDELYKAAKVDGIDFRYLW